LITRTNPRRTRINPRMLTKARTKRYLPAFLPGIQPTK
jgi:hypothetical protein